MGTANFVSNNTHKGIQQSRRDDLESIGYMLIYFLRGELPWMKINKLSENQNKLRNQMIGEVKRQTSLKELCRFSPPCFVKYFEYVKSLGFDDAPDYGYLRDLLNEN